MRIIACPKKVILAINRCGEDSGPIILLIGSSYLLFAAVYLAAVPAEGARPAAKKESRPLAADPR